MAPDRLVRAITRRLLMWKGPICIAEDREVSEWTPVCIEPTRTEDW
jgi:hypothetical protein